jgi:general secretion pathway protein A
VEEGLIEVGWDGNIEAEAATPDADAPLDQGPVVQVPAADPPGEEFVEDHYAALQAWTEWARNRSRTPSQTAVGASAGPPAAGEPDHEVEAEREFSEGRSFVQGIRVESQHEHAPYSQLFTRLRQSS